MNIDDLEIIAKGLNDVDSDIIITEEVGENIQKQLKEEIVSKIVTNEEIDLSALDIMKQKLKKHIAELQLQLMQANTEQEKAEIRKKIEIATLTMYIIDARNLKNIKIKGTNESQINVNIYGQHITIQEILEQINNFKAPIVNLNDLPDKQRREVKQSFEEAISKIENDMDFDFDFDDSNGLENSKYRIPIIRMIKEKVDENIAQIDENIVQTDAKGFSVSTEQERQDLQEKKNTALILSYILQQEISRQRQDRLYKRDMKNAVDEVLGKDDKLSGRMKASIDKDENLGLTERAIKALMKKLNIRKQELSDENNENLTPKQQKELQRRKDSVALFEYLLEKEKLRLSNKTEKDTQMQENSTLKDVLNQINQGNKVSLNINKLGTSQRVELKQDFNEYISEQDSSDEIITGNVSAAIRKSLEDNGTLGIAQNTYIYNNEEVISTLQERIEQTIKNLQEQEKNAKTRRRKDRNRKEKKFSVNF